MNAGVYMRGYAKLDGSYKINVIRLCCENKTDWHNLVRYYKQNYTNYLGAWFRE